MKKPRNTKPKQPTLKMVNIMLVNAEKRIKKLKKIILSMVANAGERQRQVVKLEADIIHRASQLRIEKRKVEGYKQKGKVVYLKLDTMPDKKILNGTPFKNWHHEIEKLLK